MNDAEREFEGQFKDITPTQLLANLKEGMRSGDAPSLREKTQSDAVKQLFDDSKLKMISRLSKGGYVPAGAILKMIILSNFYVRAWSGIRLKFTAVKINDPPFYRLTEKLEVDDLKGRSVWLATCYDDLISDVLRLSISVGGLGRAEMVDIVKSLNQMMRENELKQMRLLDMQGGMQR